MSEDFWLIVFITVMIFVVWPGVLLVVVWMSQ